MYHICDTHTHITFVCVRYCLKGSPYMSTESLIHPWETG